MSGEQRAEFQVAALVLNDDEPRVWTREKIQAALPDLSNAEVGVTLRSLEGEDVLVVAGGLIIASRCAQRLDGLGLIVTWGLTHDG